MLFYGCNFIVISFEYNKLIKKLSVFSTNLNGFYLLSFCCHLFSSVLEYPIKIGPMRIYFVLIFIHCNTHDLKVQ